jgi:hypothetical protein
MRVTRSPVPELGDWTGTRAVGRRRRRGGFKGGEAFDDDGGDGNKAGVGL